MWPPYFFQNPMILMEAAVKKVVDLEPISIPGNWMSWRGLSWVVIIPMSSWEKLWPCDLASGNPEWQWVVLSISRARLKDVSRLIFFYLVTKKGSSFWYIAPNLKSLLSKNPLKWIRFWPLYFLENVFAFIKRQQSIGKVL